MPTLEPQIDRLIRTAIESRLLDVHTCTLGRVQTVYGTPPMTCDVVLPIRRAVLSEDDSTRYEALPVLPQVPIMWPAGGGTSYPLTLAEGDTVMVFFTEDSGAEYFTSGSEAEPADLARHGMSSAYCWPMSRNTTQATDFAALASKVDAMILSVKTYLNTHTHPTPSGASSAPTTPWDGVTSVAANVTRAK